MSSVRFSIISNCIYIVSWFSQISDYPELGISIDFIVCISICNISSQHMIHWF